MASSELGYEAEEALLVADSEVEMDMDKNIRSLANHSAPSPLPNDNNSSSNGNSNGNSNGKSNGNGDVVIGIMNHNGIGGGQGIKKKKQHQDGRSWMCVYADGRSELVDLNRSSLMKQFSLPARDLRVLGPVFSNSSNILAREKVMVVNLEFIKAIVSAQEVVILDSTSSDVLPFIDRLRQQLPLQIFPNAVSKEAGIPQNEHWLPVDPVEGPQTELPFEFLVLEMALKVVCGFLEQSVSMLENRAYPTLDELVKNVNTSNLEQVRSLKSQLTRLLARVQKVRDEIEHLLDDDEEMAQLYLSRKLLLAQHAELNSNASPTRSSQILKLGSRRFSNATTYSVTGDERDVEELEMLLENYFMQVDSTRNKLLTLREYIDDTEDYVNIQLDHLRNELIQLHLTLIIASFWITVATFGVTCFGMNIPCPLYNVNGVFFPLSGSLIFGSTVLFILMYHYVYRKEHF